MMKNVALSEEEIRWIVMSIESTIGIHEDAQEWYNSQGDWAAVEKEKERINMFRKLKERLDAVVGS